MRAAKASPRGGDPAVTAAAESLEEVLARSEADGIDFAQAGIWYDALEALSDDVDDHPGDRKARFLRSALLRQVKLDAAVE